jgi:hypothetical protein|nr:hypothetical protein [Neorhizobium tomejilense]
MTLTLNVTDKESLIIGKVPVREGLRTSSGKVTRFTEKTVWTVGRSGFETMHRKTDGPLPSVPRGYAGKDFVPFEPTKKATPPVPTPKTAATVRTDAVVSPSMVLKALELLREQYRGEGLTEPMAYSGISASPAQAVTQLLSAPDVDKRLSAIMDNLLSTTRKAA